MLSVLGYGKEKKKRDAEIKTVGDLVEKSYIVEIETWNSLAENTNE